MKLWIEFMLPIILIGLLFMAACDSQYVAKNFGGTHVIELDKGKKLEMITWKEDDVWILTRDREAKEEPIVHEFAERSVVGVIQGKVIIKER